MNYVNRFSHVTDKKFLATFSAIEMFEFSNVPEFYREKLLASLRKHAAELTIDKKHFAYLSFYDKDEQDRSYPKLSSAQCIYWPNLFSCDSSETVFSILFTKLNDYDHNFETKESLDNWVLVPRIIVVDDKGVHHPITPFEEYDECPAGEPRLVGFDFYFKNLSCPTIA